jgi:hypothetical protein
MRQWLSEKFLDAGLFVDVKLSRPSRSADFNPLNSFLFAWEYLRTKIYASIV